jgi:hypothetical protein
VCIAVQSTDRSWAGWTAEGLVDGGMEAKSAAVGPVPQWVVTISVEVGLHHASPPPSNSGYSPVWISWEYSGRLSTMPSAPPSGLGTYGLRLTLGASDATAPTSRSTGVAVVPPARYSVTCNR